jgi:hypothetical protein
MLPFCPKPERIITNSLINHPMDFYETIYDAWIFFDIYAFSWYLPMALTKIHHARVHYRCHRRPLSLPMVPSLRLALLTTL